MRIGLSIRTFYPQGGGLQAHAERLCHELRARGHEVTVLTRSTVHVPSFDDYQSFSQAEAAVEVHGVPVRVLRIGAASRAVLRLAAKLVDRPALQGAGIRLVELAFGGAAREAFSGVDVVHHVGKARELVGFAAAAAARALRVPFVVQPTLHPGQWGDSPLDCELYRRGALLLTHTACESAALRRLGVETPSVVVGNGVDDRRDADDRGFRERFGIDGPFVLYLGRLEADKGFGVLFEAFAAVRRARPDVGLICVGPKTADAPPEAEAAAAGIRFLGFVSEADRNAALAACTLLCVPSVGESFGLVFMEAACYGKMSVARRLEVLQELFGDDGALCMLGRRRDDGKVDLTADELAQALVALLADPARLEAAGRKAYAVSRSHVWASVVRRFEAAYERALSRSHAG
jgi:glycosyltransferase involved in cell wall biosynthesis